MKKFLYLITGAALLCATAASAGPLLSANISASIAGAVLDYDAPGTVSGDLDTTTGDFSFDAGSGFVGFLSIPTSVTAAGGAATIMLVTLNFGNNGALAGNTATTGSVGVTGGGIPATGIATGTALGVADVTLAQVDLSFGGNVTGPQPPFTLIVQSIINLATLTLSVPDGDLWHLGTVTATGLYSGPTATPSALPSVMANGDVTTTTGGNTVVTLVTLGKLRTRTNSVQGVSESVTASPVFLTLTYAPGGSPTPEPGTVLLLGAGLLGLATVGRRKA